MTVLIAKVHQNLIQPLSINKLTFTESTKNTVTFKVTKANFEKMLEVARQKGYNPYALMTW